MREYNVKTFQQLLKKTFEAQIPGQGSQKKLLFLYLPHIKLHSALSPYTSNEKNLKHSFIQIINIEILVCQPRQDETVNKSHATI